MSWASGSILLRNVIDSIETLDNTAHEDLVHVFKYIIGDFKDADCDTVDECLGVSDAFDEAYYELYPKDDN